MVNRKLMAIAVSFLLAAGFLALFGETAGIESEARTIPESTARREVTDAFDLSTQNSLATTLYPGDSDTFHLRLTSQYNGENYDPNSPGIFNATSLFNTTLTFIGIFDEDGNPVVNNPVVWILNTVYDNDGNGWTLPAQGSTRNYFADDINTEMELAIKNESIAPGNYQIGVLEEFRYLESYDGATAFNYSGVQQNSDYLPFTVRSCVGPDTDFEYTWRSMLENNGNEPLYAGAQREKFGVKNLAENSGQLTDLTGSITMESDLITVENPICTLNSIGPGSPNMFYWRINVDDNAPPGDYTVYQTLTYMRNAGGNDYLVTETATTQTFIVLYTPLLFPPPIDTPVATITQKDVNGTFTVGFTNDGNVELNDVEIRLDLDNTRYIMETEFYINENANGGTTWPEYTKQIPVIGVGETIEVEFPMTHLIHFLPPGTYMIPVDYTCTYHDSGVTGNPSGDVSAGYWDDNAVQLLQRNIMQTNVYPEDFLDTHIPYVYVIVEDDAAGIDVEGVIGNNWFTQTQGSINRYIQLTISNYEYYAFHDMTYYIDSGVGSPFSIPGGNGSADTLPPIHRPSLNAGGTTWIGSDNFFFYADIKENANPGINYVQVDIMGYNQYLQPVEKSVYVEINIQCKQPTFDVIAVEVSNVSDDMEVTVKATIKNVGMGDAIGVGAYFISSSTGFICTDDPVALGDILTGETVTYEFKVRSAAETYNFRGSHSGNIHFDYTDEMGAYYPIYSGGQESVTYYVSSKLPDLVIQNVMAPVIEGGDTISVSITVINIGGSTARNVNVLLPYSSALFQIGGSGIIDLGDIEPNEDAQFSVQITALEEIADETTYSFTLYFSYQNIEGETETFSEGERESFSIRTKDIFYSSEQLQIVEEKGKILDEGVAMLLLGILILIGLIIFGAIFAKATRGGGAAPPPSSESSAWEEEPPRAKPARPPMAKKKEEKKEEDDWEEDEDEEDEEEEEDDEEEEEDDEEEW